MKFYIPVKLKLDNALEHKLEYYFKKILTLEDKIMTAISDFAAKITAFQTRQDTAIADVQADIANLAAQIKALQSSPGPISTDDQALLDGIEAHTSSISDKLDALDALTPPVVPAT